MSNKAKIILIVMFFLQAGQLFSQTEENDFNKIPDYVPKSPESASMLRYGDYGANLSQGLVDINIPLYTLEVGNFNLPIQLTYNPKGIKVNQEATWVGLGWDLSAGARITLEARDTADEDEDVAMPDLTQIESILAPVPSWSVSHNNLLGIMGHSWIKDVYHFTSPTVSGKFVLYPEQGDEIRIYPPDAFKVEALGNTQFRTFRITDQFGNVYDFTDTWEKSGMVGVVGGQMHRSAWLVDKITTASNRIINFEYVNDGSHASSQINDKAIETITDHPCSNPPNNEMQHFSTFQPAISSVVTQINKTYKLVKIETDNARINFDLAAGREDLATPALLLQAMYPNDVVPPKYLENLRIERKLNNTYTYVKGFHFRYSYFEASGIQASYVRKRLRLDGVEDFISDESTNFVYSDIPLPPKTSRARDVWGYYNGKVNNITLIPTQYVYVQNFVPYIQQFGGADRTVNPNTLEAGILKEIHYPTKGKTEFVYDPNDYYGTPPVSSQVQETIINGNLVEGTGHPSTATPPIACETNPNMIGCLQELVLNFTASTNTPAHLTFDINYTEGVLDINKWEYARVRVYSGGTWVYDSAVRKDDYSELNKPINLLGNGYVYIEAYGSTMRVNGGLQLKYFQTIVNNTLQNVKGPGLRIKEINNYTDENHLTAKKVFTYQLPDSNHSSGQLIFDCVRKYEPEEYYSELIEFCPAPPFWGWKETTTKIYKGESPYFSLNDVSYTDVKEENIDVINSTNNGYTQYKYNFLATSGSQDGSTLIEYDWIRGELLEKSIYNGNGKIVYKEKHKYVDDPRKISKVEGFKLSTRYTFQSIPNVNTFDSSIGPIFQDEGYSYPISWHHINSTEITETFFNSGIATPSGVTSKTIRYYYDNPDHMQLSRTETTFENNGKTFADHTYYPHDLINEPIMDLLVSHNRIAEVIRTENYEDGTLLSAQNKIYREWTNNIYEPEYLQTSKAAQPFENRVKFTSYDGVNPTQVQKENGAPTAYIWAYNDAKLVAKVENVEYVSIDPNLIKAIKLASGISEQDLLNRLEELRYSPECQNGLVTTFTYKPLIGISTIIDPKGQRKDYHYDSMCRLSKVTDTDGNIITTHEYNFRPN